jgi:hypothetical protein
MDNPTDTPRDNPKKRKDQRPTLTFKGDAFGPEFRALINKAAERSGMSQSDFVAETLRREAQRIIKGTPADTPAETPQLPAVQTERLDAQDRRIAELAEQIGKLVALQTASQAATHRASLWARVRDALRGAPGGERVAARVEERDASTPPVTPTSIPQAA